MPTIDDIDAAFATIRSAITKIRDALPDIGVEGRAHFRADLTTLRTEVHNLDVYAKATSAEGIKHAKQERERVEYWTTQNAKFVSKFTPEFVTAIRNANTELMHSHNDMARGREGLAKLKALAAVQILDPVIAKRLQSRIAAAIYYLDTILDRDEEDEGDPLESMNNLIGAIERDQVGGLPAEMMTLPSKPSAADIYHATLRIKRSAVLDKVDEPDSWRAELLAPDGEWLRDGYGRNPQEAMAHAWVAYHTLETLAADYEEAVEEGDAEVMIEIDETLSRVPREIGDHWTFRLTAPPGAHQVQ